MVGLDKNAKSVIETLDGLLTITFDAFGKKVTETLECEEKWQLLNFNYDLCV